MLTRANLYPYQQRIVSHIHEHPNAMVWADVGLGKSISTLTAIQDLQARLETGAVLVIAPLRIIQSVWRQEALKWAHTQGLRFSLVHGTEAQRESRLRRNADIYLINPENIRWLAVAIERIWLKRGKYPPFDMVVYDEITRFKSADAKRVKAWAKLLPYFRRRVGLTGEPAANGYRDLFGQYLMVDAGQRLGTSVTAYRETFLKPFGFQGRNWVVTKTGQEQIHRRIHDITIELSAEDYLDLPPIKDNVIWVDLPPKAREVYDSAESELWAMLDSGAELDIASEASKINKLSQLAGGAAYLSVNGPWEEVHRAKLEALESLVEEAGGRPQLLGYSYVHEASRIAQAFPERPQDQTGATFLSSRLGERELHDVLRRWAYNEIPLLCGHPASMGHGLNLQEADANSIIWFNLPWSLELYNQMNGRLFGGHRRRGASIIHHILARDTVDEVIFDALKNKATTQQALKVAVNRYREKRNGETHLCDAGGRGYLRGPA